MGFIALYFIVSLVLSIPYALIMFGIDIWRYYSSKDDSSTNLNNSCSDQNSLEIELSRILEAERIKEGNSICLD